MERTKGGRNNLKHIKIIPWPKKEMFQLMVGINIFEDRENDVRINEDFKDFWISHHSEFLDTARKIYAEEGEPFPSSHSGALIAINRVAVQAWISLLEGATETWVPEISLEEIHQATMCLSAYMDMRVRQRRRT